MIITTTNGIEGRKIIDYRGIVVGEAIMGANVVRELEERAAALNADAVVGVDLDYEVVGQSMLMVSASGTAVVLA